MATYTSKHIMSEDQFLLYFSTLIQTDPQLHKKLDVPKEYLQAVADGNEYLDKRCLDILDIKIKHLEYEVRMEQVYTYESNGFIKY